jgi:hypothetical protein
VPVEKVDYRRPDSDVCIEVPAVAGVEFVVLQRRVVGDRLQQPSAVVDWDDRVPPTVQCHQRRVEALGVARGTELVPRVGVLGEIRKDLAIPAQRLVPVLYL